VIGGEGDEIVDMKIIKN